ncbi:putative gustatory receptor 28b [Cylas formicarius]|uniref:putative gustatory receptor 28b n=1 Tax=Cylas formicarius TaxID=197179 RepID=UPI002958610E|nr:putative gustatory receptor 28b [Cylas formicarius]
MLLWIVVPCSLTMAESVKFVSILRKLEMESHNDRKVDGMMSLMCLQCHHLPVEFSAVGVFELNMSLLYTIWGAMTTFLVMLLQFDI